MYLYVFDRYVCEECKNKSAKNYCIILKKFVKPDIQCPDCSKWIQINSFTIVGNTYRPQWANHKRYCSAKDPMVAAAANSNQTNHLNDEQFENPMQPAMDDILDLDNHENDDQLNEDESVSVTPPHNNEIEDHLNDDWMYLNYGDDDSEEFLADLKIQQQKPVIDALDYDSIISSADSKNSFIHFQKRLQESYDNAANLKINMRPDDKNSGVKVSAMDTLQLHSTLLETNCSTADGNKWLACFHDILNRASMEGYSKIPIPNTFETIKSQVDKNIIGTNNHNLFSIREFKFGMKDVDEELFPMNLFPKQLITHSYDIMEVIAQYLLNIQDPNNFITEPDVSRFRNGHHDEPNERIIEDYMSSEHCKVLHDEVIKHIQETFSAEDLHYLNRNRSRIKPTAISISGSCDGTTSIRRNRELYPLVMSIGNCIDESFGVDLLGYVPVKLPYSDVEIFKRLNISNKSVVSKLIKLAERKLFLKYIEFVFEPILKYQDKGCYFKVGLSSNRNQKTILAFIHKVLFPADNLQSDYICGCHHANTHMKCRLCQCDNVGNLAASLPRDDNKTIATGIDGEYYLISYAKSLLNTKKRKKNTSYKSSVQICKQLNIKPGQQPLIKIIKWQVERKILTFHGLYNPDYLHSFLKGVVENIISWIVEIMYSIGKLDDRYKNAMSLLDERIKTFPIAQSLRVGRSCRFGEGISSLFKTTAKASSTKGTGAMYGSIEAWKLLPLLFQLLWCLNADIVPFEPFGSVSDNTNSKQRKPQFNWTVGKVMVNTVVAALDFHFSVSTKLVTINQIKSLEGVINNLKSQLALLWVMHKDFLQTTLKVIPKFAKERKQLYKSCIPLFTGIKHHILSHLPSYLVKYGIDQRFWDTNLSESFHKRCCKELIERSNKKFDDSCKTNLMIYKKRQHSKQITNSMTSNSNIVIDTVKEYENPTSKEYAIDAILNHGHEVIRRVDNADFLEFLSNTNSRDRDIEAAYTRFPSAVNINIIISDWLFSILQNGFSPCKTYLCDVDSTFTETYWKSFLEDKKDYSLSLLKAVSFKEVNVNDKNIRMQRKACYINDFNCFCNNAYRIDAQNHSGKARTVTVCNFVEILIQDGKTQFGEICAMIGCKSNKTGKYEKVYLLVCWLAPVQATSDDYFPFPIFKYEYMNERRLPLQLRLNLIDATCVEQPCFAIPYNSKGCQWLFNNENTMGYKADFLKDSRFYVLSKSYVRRDNDIEYDNYFLHLQKMNPIQNNATINHTKNSIYSMELTHEEIRRNILKNAPLVHTREEMDVISKFTDDFEKEQVAAFIDHTPDRIDYEDNVEDDDEEGVEDDVHWQDEENEDEDEDKDEIEDEEEDD
jgi:hypothetical protein